MRSVAGIGLLLLLLALLATAGCDSDDPAQVEDFTADITFATGNSTVPFYAVWELFFDQNGDDPGPETLENGP